jgi:hypothetical protein
MCLAEDRTLSVWMLDEMTDISKRLVENLKGK